MYTFGWQFSKTTIHLQICHIVKREYYPLSHSRPETMIIHTVWTVAALSNGLSFYKGSLLSVFALFFATVEFFWFAGVIVWRIARMLGINILRWTPPQHKYSIRLMQGCYRDFHSGGDHSLISVFVLSG